MQRYKAYCLDLDGTVYRGKEAIPEAVQFVAERQAEGKDVYFITNNAALTRSMQQEKLAAFGISAPLDRIMNSAGALAKYCKKYHEGARVFMVGEAGLEEALAAEGIERSETDADIVVMGLDRHITYTRLSEACLLIRGGAAFIGTNEDLKFPTERGLVPGNGSFLKLMEAAADKKPLIIGKPEPFMLEFIQQQGNYKKEEMVLIGDNYDTDIMAGIRYGIDTVHVDTGVTPAEEVRAKDIQPAYMVTSLAEWV